MKNRKAQFYFFAIILIAILFIGLITISNFIKIKKNYSLLNYKNSLENERNSLLNYLSSKNFSDTKTSNLFKNFSNSYIHQFGNDKTIIFIFGKKTMGNILANITSDTNVSVNGIEFPPGEIDQTFSVSGPINLKVDENNYTMDFQKGQNIYYLVQLKTNEEVYIING